MAPGAGATAPAASNTKFCKAVAGLSDNVSEDPTQGGSTAKIASEMRKAAKSAPANVKSALLTMADYFDAITGVKSNPTKIAAFLKKNGVKYGKAVSTFTTYYAQNCTDVS
jgi:hypothetical protein